MQAVRRTFALVLALVGDSIKKAVGWANAHMVVPVGHRLSTMRSQLSKGTLGFAAAFVAMLAALGSNTAGLVALGPVLAIAGVILATIIAVLLLAALAPEFFNATGDLTDAFTNSGLTGTAGVIVGILAIVVPLVLVFGFVALVMRVAKK